jgi:hypothetical protein
MAGELGHEIAKIGVRLMDDAHFAWLTAEIESEQALREWLRTASAPAYQSYCAALDREEAAANDLQRLVELARPCEGDLVASELKIEPES